MKKFKPVNNDQLYLLPPSIEDFIPANHLARIINEVVDTINVREIELKYSHLGQKSYHPHLLLKILFYGYSIGMRSGRKIAAACESDTAFMYLAAMYKPDFRTINDFRKDNLDFIGKAFVHVVQLCKGLGMCKTGVLIIDSTKLKANANCNISITGYPAASKASQALCSKRTQAIKQYLMEQEGISSDRITTNCEIGGGDANTVDIKSVNK